MKFSWIAFLVIPVAMMSGCSVFTTPFYFPAEDGNIADGRQAFIDHQCTRCHSVAGEQLPALAGAAPPILELGGPTSQAKTYAELVTSVINPNHIISDRYREQLGIDSQVVIDSPMPVPDLDRMTVRQLIDIVAYLDSRYVLVEGYDSYDD